MSLEMRKGKHRDKPLSRCLFVSVVLPPWMPELFWPQSTVVTKPEHPCTKHLPGMMHAIAHRVNADARHGAVQLPCRIHHGVSRCPILPPEATRFRGGSPRRRRLLFNSALTIEGKVLVEIQRNKIGGHDASESFRSSGVDGDSLGGE